MARASDDDRCLFHRRTLRANDHPQRGELALAGERDRVQTHQGADAQQPMTHAPLRDGAHTLPERTRTHAPARGGASVHHGPADVQCPAPLAASLIFAIASSIVNEFGRWTAGKSLNVSANLAAAACAT